LPEIQVQAQSNPIKRYPGGQIASGSRVASALAFWQVFDFQRGKMKPTGNALAT